MVLVKNKYKIYFIRGSGGLTDIRKYFGRKFVNQMIFCPAVLYRVGRKNGIQWLQYMTSHLVI